MPKLRNVLISASSGIFLAGAAAVAYVWLSPTPAETREPLDNVLSRSGYLELRPASRFGGPGSFGTVDKITSTYIMLHPTCALPQDELEKTWNESPTNDSNLTEQLSGTFGASIGLVEKINQSLGSNLVTTVKVSLANARIILVPDEVIYSLRDKYLRDNCEKTIIRLTKMGSSVCQTSSTLMADIVYKIEYNNAVTDNIKARLTDKIAAEVALGGKRVDQNTLSGEKLFVGIKLSQECIIINEPTAQPIAIKQLVVQEIQNNK